MTTTRTTAPSTIRTTSHAPAPALSDDDPRAVLARAVAMGGSVIAAVEADQLGDATPCDHFDVRQLLGHLVGVLRRLARVGRGQDPFAPDTVVEGVADEGWSAAWTAAAQDVAAAWSDDATLEQVVRLPWAELSGAGTLASYTNEVTVHTWDLARATGQAPAWDDAVLEVAFAAIRQVLPAESRLALFQQVQAKMPAGVGPFAPPFAEAVAVAPDAPLIDRLVAWNGRHP